MKSGMNWKFVIALVTMLISASGVMAQDTGTAALAESVQKALDTSNSLTTDINIIWVLLTAFLVFFMQAGFALVETVFTRAKNVSHTMMMNMMVFCIGAVGYWLTGFAFQFGAVNFTWPSVGSLSAWSHAPTTLGDWSGGWLQNLGRIAGLGNGAVDFAGSGVVHMSGGTVGLVRCES